MTDTANPEQDVVSSDNSEQTNSDYQVLARKYRPADFSALIGQDALVRTLTNAIDTGRLHHAFVLTGVRGIGKTTTARIIARALNCIGPDGQGGPTAKPCGICDNCRAIAEDRHVDVIEMDAASRTGVDDIRELIEGVRYRPTSARFKIYIIDEVHMLSKNAFNALLKTLEEPPEHVKFVFATTEIRKVPVTVLSRCMRFDLRRVDTELLAHHFKDICLQENAKIDDVALAMIARAADGSVRDGLSLLDQAISQSVDTVDEAQVRAMLGLADRGLCFDMLDSIMKGDINAALNGMSEQYQAGADPVQVVEDLLDLTHWLTRLKVEDSVADVPGVPEMERNRGREMTGGLTMAALTRAWQMLLKGLGEIRIAPNPEQAAEMVIIRLAYAASLPSPADLAKKIEKSNSVLPPTEQAEPDHKGSPANTQARNTLEDTKTKGDISADGGGSRMAQTRPTDTDAPTAMRTGTDDADATPAETLNPEPKHSEVPEVKPDPMSFDAVIDLTQSLREPRLRYNLTHNVRLIRFEPGVIEFSQTDAAPKNLAQVLSNFLNHHTARRWMIGVKGDGGGATIKEVADQHQAGLHVRAANSDLVKAVLDTFPEAKIEEVKDLKAFASGIDQAISDGDLEDTDEADYNPLDDAPDLD